MAGEGIDGETHQEAQSNTGENIYLTWLSVYSDRSIFSGRFQGFCVLFSFSTTGRACVSCDLNTIISLETPFPKGSRIKLWDKHRLLKKFVKRVHALQEEGNRKYLPNYQFDQYTLVGSREEIKGVFMATASELVQAEATV